MHPPLAPDHVDAPHHEAALGALRLESGEAIADYRQSFVTHGAERRSHQRDPALPGADGHAPPAIRARSLLLAPPLDLFNPSNAARDAAAAIPSARFVEIPSRHGHLAASSNDAEDARFLNETIGAFLA